MSIIYILIPIAILLTILGIYLFFWAVKTEQFEDLEKQGMSILFDENQQSKTIDENQKDVIEDPKQSSDKQ
jgi:cbb3-type cytochrome oxidase maturation protein